MMRNIKLTIEYDGTNFRGWQVQSKGQQTIQGEIEKALNKIFQEKCKLTGSGRTDSGVHALGQVANFKTNSSLPLDKIKNALNANLPDEISILKVEDVKPVFHAQYSVKSKAYRYVILNRESRSPQLRNYCLLYPHKLNLRLIREEAKELIGRKDFKSFKAADARNKSKKGENTVRTIKSIHISKRGDFIYIDIEANGFLYKMVRNIVGTLLEIGRGRLPKGSIKEILKKKDRTYAGYTAKPQGLALLYVKY